METKGALFRYAYFGLPFANMHGIPVPKRNYFLKTENSWLRSLENQFICAVFCHSSGLGILGMDYNTKHYAASNKYFVYSVHFAIES